MLKSKLLISAIKAQVASVKRCYAIRNEELALCKEDYLLWFEDYKKDLQKRAKRIANVAYKMYADENLSKEISTLC